MARIAAEPAPERTPPEPTGARPAIAGPAGASRILALQRAAGNAAVGRLLARQEVVDLTGRPNVYMLKPPPARRQNSLTCWAASLSSWLEVLGVQKIATDDVVGGYIGTSCINIDNSLPESTAAEVYDEWAVKWEFFVPSDGKPTGAQWRERLKKRGHLLLALTGHALGHVIVVYGSGFDSTGAPDPNYISVMDPMIGGHQNIRADSLPTSFAIGHLGTERKRPAACRSKPAVVPDEPKD
jgi:Papain-like cysteine protease AvrRpt2